MQGVEVLVKRPAGLGANADGVRVVLEKVSSVTTAVDCDLHLLGLRKASEAEVLAATAAPGTLTATVSTLSGTVTGIGDTLAFLQSSLATTAPGGVLSHLALNYMTAASTTSAIAAASTTLSASIAGVSSDLHSNYYTRVQVDGGIATAVGGVSTTLGGRIDTAEATISDEAGFRVAADGVLAGRIVTMEARRDPGSVVTNGSFTDGLFTGWSGAAVPTASSPSSPRAARSPRSRPARRRSWPGSRSTRPRPAASSTSATRRTRAIGSAWRSSTPPAAPPAR